MTILCQEELVKTISKLKVNTVKQKIKSGINFFLNVYSFSLLF